MAEYVNILPADENTKGNVWCAACGQSIRAANEERHLISAKHAENAAAETKKGPKGGKKDAEKAAKKSEARPEGPESEEKPMKASKGPKASKAESSESVQSDAARATESVEADLPLDPKPAPGKEGNRYCGICEQSLGPSKVKSHLGSKKHQANADKVLADAMQKVAV